MFVFLVGFSDFGRYDWSHTGQDPLSLSDTDLQNDALHQLMVFTLPECR